VIIDAVDADCFESGTIRAEDVGEGRATTGN
jgi:hypothetical protein